MKVAFVISHPIQYYVPLIQGLAKNKNLVVKVFYTWGEGSVKKYDPAYNKVIEWDLPLLENYEFEFLKNVSSNPGSHHFNGIDNPSIINKIKEFSPDKIVVFSWSYKSHLKVLRYFKGKIPIYFRGDSHLINNKFGVKSLMRKWFLTWVYKHIDFAISVGTNNRLYYKWLGLPDDRILFAPHAIDDSRFINPIDSDVDANYHLEIPKENIVFLYCGSFEARKNIPLIVEAKLKLKDKACSLILVGNGEDENKAKELAKSDSNIHFIDFVNQSELPKVYSKADVFVLASNVETWGLVINEAMASGLAIIASENVGSAVDLVKGNGFIVKVNEANSIAEAMSKLIDNKKLLNDCKLKSKDIIKDWSMSELINKFEIILMKKNS